MCIVVVNEFAMREPCMSQILEENAELRRKLQSLQEYFNQIYGKVICKIVC